MSTTRLLVGPISGANLYDLGVRREAPLPPFSLPIHPNSQSTPRPPASRKLGGGGRIPSIRSEPRRKDVVGGVAPPDLPAPPTRARGGHAAHEGRMAFPAAAAGRARKESGSHVSGSPQFFFFPFFFRFREASGDCGLGESGRGVGKSG